MTPVRRAHDRTYHQRMVRNGSPGGRVIVGTSGWHYLHWRDVLYDPHEAPETFLATYARTFDAVEVNATFYRRPTAAVVARWVAVVGERFVFAAKVHRTITHRLRLRDADEAMRAFLESVAGIGERLEVVLAQLPPQFGPDPERLEAFLAALPSERPRLAFEFRHPGWYRPSTYRVLERFGAALCVHDHSDGATPERERARVTAPFAYLRLHGGETGRYGPECQKHGGATPLDGWERRVREWLDAEHDAYVFFNNDAGGHAVRDACELAARLGVQPNSG